MTASRWIGYLAFAASIGGCTGVDTLAIAPDTTASVDDYVQTPAGLYHRSCVYEVPEGATIDDGGGTITSPDGRVAHVAPCSYPAIRDQQRAQPGTGAGTTANNVPASPTINGWIEASFGNTGGNLSGLDSDFTVPSNPPSGYGSGETLFMFPGINSSDNILQPVLQYGNGTNAWMFASWRCNSGSNCFHGPYYGTAAGHVFHGAVVRNYCTDSCNYTIITTDVSTGVTSSVNTNETLPYTLAVGAALEVYGLNSCDKFPASDPTTFSNLRFYDDNGNRTSPSWSPVSWAASPSCSFSVDIGGDWTALHYRQAQQPSGYQGCFIDDSNRALPAYQGDGYSLQACTNQCSALGYAYAGSQYYSECFCGNGIGYGQVSDGECNTPCTSGGGYCGGAWRNSIYATGSSGGGGGGGGITFYYDINFGGASFSASSDVDFVGWDWNDRISSIRIPAGRSVILYQDWYYGGGAIQLTGDVSDLRDYGVNDWASSIRIQ